MLFPRRFLAATNRVGLSLNYDSQQLTDYRIGCVGTAFRLYKQMGEPLYCETMRLIVAAWEGKPDSFRASVRHDALCGTVSWRVQ